MGPDGNRAGQTRLPGPSVPAVSKSAKSVSGTPASNAMEPEIPFEEALQKLESIVEAMESGDLTLEQLLSRFEEGTRLARACQTRLEAAEVRVQQLERSLSGDLATRPVAVSGADADA